MFLDDIATYLKEQGRGTVGTNIFKSFAPESPDNLIAVFETGGVEPDKDLPTADPTFQVYVRNKSYATGKALVDNIVDDLHQKTNSTLVVAGVYFYFILLMGEPGHIGRDASNRDEFSMNFRCRIRR